MVKPTSTADDMTDMTMQLFFEAVDTVDPSQSSVLGMIRGGCGTPKASRASACSLESQRLRSSFLGDSGRSASGGAMMAGDKCVVPNMGF